MPINRSQCALCYHSDKEFRRIIFFQKEKYYDGKYELKKPKVGGIALSLVLLSNLSVGQEQGSVNY
jgi:hypothetical protein